MNAVTIDPGILTVTPNPAIDITCEVSQIDMGQTHQVPPVTSRSGGKGVAVSQVLHSQGHATKVLSTYGGTSGIEFQAGLQGLAQRLIEVAAPTRKRFSLVDQANEQVTVFQEHGGALTAAEWQSLVEAYAEEVASAAVSVISGSLPGGAPNDYFYEVVRIAQEEGAPVIVDTSGTGLRQAAFAAVDLVKPNREELITTIGDPNPISAARSLLDYGAQRVLFSDGEQGMTLMLAGQREYYTARLPEPLSGNLVGVEEAAVAGVAIVLADGNPDPVTLLRQATAWGAAAVLSSVVGELADNWQDLETQIQLEESVL